MYKEVKRAKLLTLEHWKLEARKIIENGKKLKYEESYNNMKKFNFGISNSITDLESWNLLCHIYLHPCFSSYHTPETKTNSWIKQHFQLFNFSLLFLSKISSLKIIPDIQKFQTIIKQLIEQIIQNKESMKKLAEEKLLILNLEKWKNVSK